MNLGHEDVSSFWLKMIDDMDEPDVDLAEEDEASTHSRYYVTRFRLIPIRSVAKKRVVVCRRAPGCLAEDHDPNEDNKAVALEEVSSSRSWRVRSLLCTYGFQSFNYYRYVWRSYRTFYLGWVFTIYELVNLSWTSTFLEPKSLSSSHLLPSLIHSQSPL